MNTRVSSSILLSLLGICLVILGLHGCTDTSPSNPELSQVSETADSSESDSELTEGGTKDAASQNDGIQDEDPDTEDLDAQVPENDETEVPDATEEVLDISGAEDGDETQEAPFEGELDIVESTPDAISVFKPDPEWWEDPIAAKPYEWTWVDFPETRCADGSPTGLGINIAPGATQAIIMLEGGGACWSLATCFGVVQTSFHLTGYDEGTFNNLLAEVYKDTVLLDREDPKNPLVDAHMVFIPYCTGDAFVGSKVTNMGGIFQDNEVHFWGRNNVKEYLKRLAPTFQGVEHVVVTGASAGGFGAAFNWDLFHNSFPEARVDILDDSGPPLDPPESQWESWLDAWGPEFPEDCPDCSDNVHSLVNHHLESLAGSGRFGLISYTNDAIISTFFGVLPFQFEDKLNDLCLLVDEVPNAQYFIVSGALHTTTIVGYDNIETEEGLPLWYWVTQMINDDPEWSSHQP